MLTAEVTYQKGSNADVTVAVAAQTITAVKNHNADVNTANYTFNDGILTLKSTYLENLSAGEKRLTIITESDSMTVTLIIKE